MRRTPFFLLSLKCTALVLLSFIWHIPQGYAVEKKVLRVGYAPIITHLPLIIAYDNDKYNFNHVNLKVTRYYSYTSIEASLRVGAIDAGLLPIPIALAISGDGYAIKILGSIVKGGSRIMGKQKGELSTLKGALIGVPGLDSNENLILSKIMEKNGLRHGKDYKTIDSPLRKILSNFKADAIDAVFFPEPFCSILENQGLAHPVLSPKNPMNDFVDSVLVIRSELLDHKIALTEWLGAIQKACEFIESDISSSGGQQIAIMQNEYFSFQKQEIMDCLLNRKGDLSFQLSPSDLDQIKNFMDLSLKMKMINKSVNFNDLVDQELVRSVSK